MSVVVLLIKIFVVVIPILLVFAEKGRSKWYLSAIVLLFILSVWNEISEHIAKDEDKQEKANLHKIMTFDSNRIYSLLKYDTTITMSNNSLKDKADSLLTSNNEIQKKLDAIRLAIANSNYKYDAIYGRIVPLNSPLANEKEAPSINDKKSVKNNYSISYYQEKISRLQNRADLYKRILKKDSANLKSVSEIDWYKLRSNEKIKDDIDIARLQLYKDLILFKGVNDSILYYQGKFKSTVSN